MQHRSYARLTATAECTAPKVRSASRSKAPVLPYPQYLGWVARAPGRDTSLLWRAADYQCACTP